MCVRSAMRKKGRRTTTRTVKKVEARIRLKTIPHAYGLVLLTAAAA